MSGPPADDLRLNARRNPLRLVVSASLWRSAWFLVVYVFASGWLLFAASLTAVTTAAVLSVTIAGIPLLAGAAGVLRGCANAERFRLRQAFTQPVAGRYRPVTGKGVFAQATTRWRDGATWRDLAYLLGLWVPLFALDTAVVAVWLVLLGGISCPIWYRYTGSTFHGHIVHGLQLGYFPNGPGAGAANSWGVYVDTLPKALLTAAACLVLFLIFNYVLVATARLHALAARAVLRAHGDPLAAARDVLAQPGPLQSLTP
ncbi:MAG: sensor domain-containing protein [Streptosporangiaceae bacterium]